MSWCRDLGVGCGCFHSVFVVVLISFGAGPALIFHVPVPHLWCRRELVDRLHQAASDNTALQRRVKEGEQAAADYRCPCLRRRASSRSAHRRILSLQTRARGRVNHRAESAQRAAAHSHYSGFVNPTAFTMNRHHPSSFPAAFMASICHMYPGDAARRSTAEGSVAAIADSSHAGSRVAASGDWSALPASSLARRHALPSSSSDSRLAPPPLPPFFDNTFNTRCLPHPAPPLLFQSFS